MSTPLHAEDVLVELASGPPGFPRDWANVRLAVARPDQMVGLPDDDYDGALVMAAGAPAALTEVLAGLRGPQPPPSTALRAEQLSSFGLLPADPFPWIEPLRGAIRGDGSPSDLYLTQLLADLGGLDGASLSAAGRVAGEEAEMAMPALVLRFAEASGGELAPTAKAVADQLASREVSPVGVRNVLALLGVPHLVVEDLEDEVDVVAAVAERMGKEAPSVPRARGAARRRAQKVVRHLLDGVPGPAAAMIQAASEAEIGEGRGLVAAATWARLREATDPLEAVLTELAGEERPLLAAARRAWGGDHEADAWDHALRATIADPRLELCPTTLLAVDRARDHGGWQEPMLDRFLRDPGVDVRAILSTTLVFARSPDHIPPLLRERGTRSVGLLFARLVPTEEVLEALLELPIPGTQEQLELYVQALAEMADPAALAALKGVADAGHDVAAQAMRDARALLGR